MSDENEKYGVAYARWTAPPGHEPIGVKSLSEMRGEPQQIRREGGRTMSEDLKPCPFCGSGTVIVKKTMLDAEGRYYVFCKTCEARGSSAYCSDVAQDRWNDAWRPPYEQNKPELKSCPHCGETEDLHIHEENDGSGMIFVYCHSCGARGGWEYDERQAINSWNRRADDEAGRI